MITFLLSLCVVDSQQRAWRVAQHQHNDVVSWWKQISPWTWWDAEPYQSPHDSTWQHVVQDSRAADGTHGIVPGSSTGTHPWHTHKKHRKMAKLMMSDAFEMRGTMAFALVTMGLLGLVTVAWLVKRLYSSLG